MNDKETFLTCVLHVSGMKSIAYILVNMRKLKNVYQNRNKCNFKNEVSKEYALI